MVEDDFVPLLAAIEPPITGSTQHVAAEHEQEQRVGWTTSIKAWVKPALLRLDDRYRQSSVVALLVILGYSLYVALQMYCQLALPSPVREVANPHLALLPSTTSQPSRSTPVVTQSTKSELSTIVGVDLIPLSTTTDERTHFRWSQNPNVTFSPYSGSAIRADMPVGLVKQKSERRVRRDVLGRLDESRTIKDVLHLTDSIPSKEFRFVIGNRGLQLILEFRNLMYVELGESLHRFLHCFTSLSGLFSCNEENCT